MDDKRCRVELEQTAKFLLLVRQGGGWILITKHDLEILRELHREKRSVEDRINRLRAMVERTSPNLDGMPHGGQQRDLMAEYMANYDDAISKLSAIEKQLANEIERIETEIRGAKLTPLQMSVIWMRYAEGKTITQIKNELHYGRSHIYRAYTSALIIMFSKEGTK